MAFETREEVFERVICQEKPACPHCGEPMKLWEVPPVDFTDGLGWGEPFMFACFNDECPTYVGGWENMQENYGRKVSYRCICYPASGNFECMPVWGNLGGTGQIIDEIAIEERKRMDERIAEGLAVLEAWEPAGNGNGSRKPLEMLLDAAEPPRVRLRAAEIVMEHGDVSMIEPMENHKFGNEKLRQQVQAAIEAIHERNFTKECPFCAEIIKKKAKICKHCGSDVSGQ